MNSSPRSQRAAVAKPALLLVMHLMIGLLFLVFGGGQAFAQSPAPNLPVEWTSLAVPDQKSPLTNLRQSDPSGLLNEDQAVERISGNTSYLHRQNRSEPAISVQLTQPGLRHRQLYFQDEPIERGNAERRFPNVAAGANFFKSLIVFPIRLVTGN